jgi:3-keto-disaccharide hydrolase
MRVHHILIAVPALTIATLTAQQPTTAPAAQGAGQQPPSAAAGPPTFFPPNFIGYAVAPPPVTVPDGFTPLFNGTTLSGWHVSRTNHHGRTPDFFVMHGAIIASQNPFGGGGILLTDKKYKNFELYMEVKPDWGCDSGIFLRSTESGAAYQVTMDFLPNGGMGAVIGEGGMTGVGGRGRANAPAAGSAGRAAAPAAAPPQPNASAPAARGAAAPQGPPPGFGQGNQADRPWVKVWKRDDWNAVRVRMEGEIPHVQVWFNDVQITDFTDVANNAIGGITEGPIAIQVHGGPSRWVQGGFWRWRNLGIKELP